MYENQSGEFVCWYWGLKGLNYMGALRYKFYLWVVKIIGFWASDLYEYLRRKVVNPMQLRYIFSISLWNEKNITFVRSIGSITSHYSCSLFGRHSKGKKDGIWAWECAHRLHSNTQTQETAEIEPQRNATRIKDKICYPSRPHTSDVIDLDEKSPPDNSCFMKRTDLSQLIVVAS